MADKKISQLTGAATPLAGTEVLPIVQSGSTVKVSAADVTAGRAVSALTYTSTVATGTAPFTVSSTTQVANLNAATAGTASNLKSNATTGVLQVVGPAAASTRVMTTPDANFSVARTDTTQTFTNGQYFAPNTGDSGAQVRVVWNSTYGRTIHALESGGGNARPLAILSQEVTLANDSGIFGSFNTSGNYAPAAAKGIDFSANSHAAGMTSELLNWYEEGTWTPTITGSSTAGTVAYDSQVGKYTRIGRMVTVSCIVDTGTVTAAPTGDLRVAGLPFAPANTYEHVGPAVLKGIPFPASTSYVCVTTYAGETYVGFLASGSDASAAFVQADSLATDDYVRFTLTYFV